MARTDRSPRASARAGRAGSRRGGMFTGVFIGILAGLVVAAAMAWYFLGGAMPFKEVPQAPAVAAAPRQTTAPPAISQHDSPAPEAGQSEYTFFDILPEDKSGKQALAHPPREVWWLQVAALSQAKDADQLKAKLSLLGLDVRVQKISSTAQPLYRVRVGPYKTEDDALAALDTLSANKFEPTLLKESTGNN